MRMKKMIVSAGVMVAVSGLCLLSACSSPVNPLGTAKPKVAAQFLVNASQFAEKKLHVFNAPGGYYYGQCMNGKEQKSLCEKLYQAMADYAQSTTDFKGMTAHDFTDQMLFDRLEEDYNQERFNSV